MLNRRRKYKKEKEEHEKLYKKIRKASPKEERF